MWSRPQFTATGVVRQVFFGKRSGWDYRHCGLLSMIPIRPEADRQTAGCKAGTTNGYRTETLSKILNP